MIVCCGRLSHWHDEYAFSAISDYNNSTFMPWYGSPVLALMGRPVALPPVQRGPALAVPRSSSVMILSVMTCRMSI